MSRPKKSAEVALQSVASELKGIAGFSTATSVLKPKEFISTGFDSLDEMLYGGFPLRKVIHISGNPSQGKSLMCYRLTAMAQRQYPNKYVVYVDTEYSYDADWATRQGINNSQVLLVQNNIAEETHKKIVDAIKSDKVSAVILDSVGNEQIESQSWIAEKRNIQPGQFAKAIKALMLDVVPLIHEKDVCFVTTNQISSKIGGNNYGPTTDNPGGHNLKHNIQLNLSLRKIEDVLDSSTKEIIGVKVAVTVNKIKYGVVSKTDESNHPIFYNDNGIEKARVLNLYDDAVRADIVTTGTWIKVQDKNQNVLLRMQGLNKFKERFLEPEFYNAIKQLINGSTTVELPPEPITVAKSNAGNEEEENLSSDDEEV
ncbi:MAG TPA: ATPase domain-containing protein [Aquella sp.]|nr:ATPase domain-containing protein [Aquella sp.]